eukprot:1160743-Pelagomonas_calceolata.AAC.8
MMYACELLKGGDVIWDALKAAAECEDMESTKLILESAGIIVNTTDMTICYDERGAKYDLPKNKLTPAQGILEAWADLDLDIHGGTFSQTVRLIGLNKRKKLIVVLQEEIRSRRTVLTLLAVVALGLQSISWHPVLFLIAGPVYFLCPPYFSQSELRPGEELVPDLHAADNS